MSAREVLTRLAATIAGAQRNHDRNRGAKLPTQPPQEPMVAYFWVPLPQEITIDPGPHFPDIEDNNWPTGFVKSSDDAPIESHNVSLVFHQIPGKSLIPGQAAAGAAAIASLAQFQSRANRGYPRLPEAESIANQTVVEGAVDLPTGWEELSTDSNPHLRSALEAVLVGIRITLLGLHQTSRQAFVAPTLETLPSLIPFAITDSQRPLPQVQSVNLLRNELGEQSHDLTHHSEEFRSPPLQKAVFANYLAIRNDAEVALKIRGEYRSALMLYACAGEALVNTWLSLLMWEDGLSPQDAAIKFPRDQGILKRARTEFSSRIGGTWSSCAKNGAGDWQQFILNPRNTSIHAGSSITRSQAYIARESLDTFRRYVGGLIFKKSRNYPFTATVTHLDLLMTPTDSPDGPKSAFAALEQRYDDNAWRDWTSWKFQLDTLLAPPS